MAYAIIRIEKIKKSDKGSVGAHKAHCGRTRETQNADPGRTHLNQVLLGSIEHTQDFLDKRWDELEQKGRKHRSDAVGSVEVLLTASPEFFNDNTLNSWVMAQKKFLAAEFGAENIAHATLHLDESTPHIHALIVPVENSQLNAKARFGGREKLSAFQDRYYEANKGLGLERGVRGSDAKHTSIKEYYAELNELKQSIDMAVDTVVEPSLTDRAFPSVWREKQQKLNEQELKKASVARLERKKLKGLVKSSRKAEKQAIELKKRSDEALKTEQAKTKSLELEKQQISNELHREKSNPELANLKKAHAALKSEHENLQSLYKSLQTVYRDLKKKFEKTLGLKR